MKNCKKHEWEFIHAVTYVTPRYGIYQCKKCGKIIESETELPIVIKRGKNEKIAS